MTATAVEVSAGQFISVADITAGKLVFTPAANANGYPQAICTLQVQDDVVTGNSCYDLAQPPDPHSFPTRRSSDLPVGADTTVSTSEDTAYTFTAANFALTDPNDSPANNQLGGAHARIPIT